MMIIIFFKDIVIEILGPITIARFKMKIDSPSSLDSSRIEEAARRLTTRKTGRDKFFLIALFVFVENDEFFGIVEKFQYDFQQRENCA